MHGCVRLAAGASVLLRTQVQRGGGEAGGSTRQVASTQRYPLVIGGEAQAAAGLQTLARCAALRDQTYRVVCRSG